MYLFKNRKTKNAAMFFAAAYIVIFTFTATGAANVKRADAEPKNSKATVLQTFYEDRRKSLAAINTVQIVPPGTETAEIPEPEVFVPETQPAVYCGPAVSGVADIVLYNCATGENENLTLEQYVLGTLLAEMPTSFCPQALRAQAIACRTYAVYNIVNGKRHGNVSSLCTNSGHCQAYCNPYTVSQSRLCQAQDAVNSTAGEIMYYNNKPVLAAFHSSSGGKTKSSAEVWGGHLEYLVSVDTFEGNVPEMNTTAIKTYSLQEFIKKMKSIKAFKDLPDSDILNITLVKNPSGKVQSIKAGGVEANGNDGVSALGLRSCDYDIDIGDKVTVTCYGYGHGVGLSQYGAEEMARRGADCYEILAHYYTGVAFGKVE